MTATPKPSSRSSSAGQFCRRGARLALRAACAAAALGSSSARSEPGAGAPPARSAAPIRIELRAVVEVAHARVALGDVAVVTTRDLPTLRRLVDLGLGNAPRAGEAVRLDRAQLMRWVRARAGIETTEIEWAGSRTSEIRREVREVAGEAIAQRAAETLRAQLSRSGLRVELDVAQQPRDVAVPDGRVELRVRPVPQTAVVPKRLSVWVDVWVEGQFVRTVPVGFEVAVFGPAYVATQDQPAGRVLDPSALAVREVEWSGRSAPPVAPTAAGPMRLRRPLSAGDTVTRAQVEAAPLVTRGGWATLRATQGMVTLESRVEVLQDGRSGQSVPVKVPNSGSAVLARVTGPGTVEVGP